MRHLLIKLKSALTLKKSCNIDHRTVVCGLSISSGRGKCIYKKKIVKCIKIAHATIKMAALCTILS